MNIGTSILFVNKQKQILLLLRDDKPNIPYPNCWDILGGNVEEGETPEQCIIREMREEIGRDIQKLQLFKKYDMEDRTEFTYWEEAEINIKETNLTEGQRLKWFTEQEINDLPEKNIAFNFKPVILEFFKEALFK